MSRYVINTSLGVRRLRRRLRPFPLLLPSESNLPIPPSPTFLTLRELRQTNRRLINDHMQATHLVSDEVLRSVVGEGLTWRIKKRDGIADLDGEYRLTRYVQPRCKVRLTVS